VEGWVWGPGSVTQASPPPLLTFEDVCSQTATLGGVSSVQTADTEEPAGARSWPSYLGFAAIVLVLGALTFLVARRRRGIRS
jgi:hypothetical protein